MRTRADHTGETWEMAMKGEPSVRYLYLVLEKKHHEDGEIRYTLLDLEEGSVTHVDAFAIDDAYENPIIKWERIA